MARDKRGARARKLSGSGPKKRTQAGFPKLTPAQRLLLVRVLNGLADGEITAHEYRRALKSPTMRVLHRRGLVVIKGDYTATTGAGAILANRAVQEYADKRAEQRALERIANAKRVARDLVAGYRLSIDDEGPMTSALTRLTHNIARALVEAGAR